MYVVERGLALAFVVVEVVEEKIVFFVDLDVVAVVVANILVVEKVLIVVVVCVGVGIVA